MNSYGLKQSLKSLLTTPLMPEGMYSQLCRDDKHHGQCIQCECWCHMKGQIAQLRAELDRLKGSVS